MRKLSNDDYKLFKTLASLTQEGLRKTMVNYLGKKYSDLIVTKDFIYAPGEIPIALVAHMDTVFLKPPKNIYFDREQGVMWSPEGLGADDRAGVFAIIKVLQSKLRPTIILTTDEEKGCIGADALIQAYPKAPTELRYIIQLDRRGTVDCVFYDCDNEEFVDYVSEFGFIEEIGSLSDISVICPQWGMAGVNLSVGYDNEHSEIETLNTYALLETIEKVKKMLTVENIPAFKYIPSPYAGWYYGKYYSAGKGKANGGLAGGITRPTYNWDFSDYVCSGCKKDMAEYEVIPAVNAYGQEVYFCPDCCLDYVEWCDACSEGYVLSEAERKARSKGGEPATGKIVHLCPSCNAKLTIKGDKKTC